MNFHTTRRAQQLFLLLLLLPLAAFSQSDVRSRIDADRRYMSYLDDKALEKSREFIRMDSTYFAGYMVEGGYKFYRANDELGFQQVIAPLEKAMKLIERDYDQELRTRTNDLMTFIRVSNYQNDYTTLAYWLEQSYQNIEEPGKAMDVLKRVRDRNIQYESGIETYNTMAWIYHRNRMYTPKSGSKYSFLKNSVKDNDSMAFMYLDSAIYKTRNDASLNVGLFDASYINRQYLFTYHYKAILFDYNLMVDSAMLYYNILMQTGYYSSNNYAEFMMSLGRFKEADDYFHEAEQREGSVEKRTREYFYMRGMLDIYRGHPEASDTLLKKVIEKQGATPGFGWHSIGLARALSYEGLTAESQARNTKAANFHELHIATTWGQEQYNLAVALLNYKNELQFEKEYYFENDQWYFWFHPVNWYNVAMYDMKTHSYKLVLASLVKDNPERAQVIYPVFSSENLINFDEVNTLLEGFGNKFFIRLYKTLEETDKRPRLKKYFRYMLGKLYLADGDKSNAREYFEQVLNDPEINDPYEKLLYARTCEGMALSASTGSDKEYWTQQMYQTFPQLLPFSEVKMKFNLETNGVEDVSGSRSKLAWALRIFGFLGSLVFYFLVRSGRIKMKPGVALIPFAVLLLISLLPYFGTWGGTGSPSSQMLSDLKTCRIDFTHDDNDVPTVMLEFTEKEDATVVNYSVIAADHSTILNTGSLRVSSDLLDQGGKLLAYRLFNIRKTEIGIPAALQKEQPNLLKKNVKPGQQDSI